MNPALSYLAMMGLWSAFVLAVAWTVTRMTKRRNDGDE